MEKLTQMKSEEKDLGIASQNEKLIVDDIYGGEQGFPFPPGTVN